MKARLALSLLPLSLLLLSSCGGDDSTEQPADRACQGDDDCDATEHCVDTACVPRSADLGVADAGDTGEGGADLGPQSDQGPGEADLADGGPSPDQGGVDLGQPDIGPTCTDSAECEVDEFCNPDTHQCQLACRPCDEANACREGFHCDFRRGDYGCCNFECANDESCAEDQYCDAEIKECRAGCRADSCGEEQHCDLATRTCAAGCVDHANCPVGTVCDAPNCVPGCLADAGCEEGQRCDLERHECTWGCVADADCARGQRCSRAERLCRLSCSEDAECPEGLRCEGAPGLCTSPAERCDAVGAAACEVAEPALICNPFVGRCLPPAGAECSGPSGCAAAETCLPIPEDGAAPSLHCFAVSGAAGPAAACQADADCASGLCLNAGRCFAACVAAEDCEEGQRCWPGVFYLGPGFDPRDARDDEVAALTYCQIPPPACSSGADCLGGDTLCRPWVDPDGPQLSSACLTPAPGALAPGQLCHADDECATGHCTDEGLCLQLCAEDEECGEGRVCGQLSLALGAVQGSLPACRLAPGSGAPCTRHTGCEVPGEFCRAEDQGGALQLVCRPGPGPAAPSAACDHPLDCQSGLCLPRGLCFGACEDEESCGGDLLCQEDALGLGGLPAGGRSRSCISPEIPCLRDADCPRAEYACSPGPLGAAGGVGLLCRPAVGPDAAGWACRTDAECRSGLCVHPARGESYCYGACADSADCPEGLNCDPAGYRAQDGEEIVALPSCVTGGGTGGPCSSDAECPAEEVCTARVAPDGASLETVCIEPLVEEAPWFCQSDDECPNGICIASDFFGSCLSLCSADEDCGLPGFLVCLESPLVVDGVEGQVRQCVLGGGI